MFAWVNDEQTLRKRGAKSDPYAVFRAMLKRGNPPADWDALVKAVGGAPADIAEIFRESGEPDDKYQSGLVVRGDKSGPDHKD